MAENAIDLLLFEQAVAGFHLVDESAAVAVLHEDVDVVLGFDTDFLDLHEVGAGWELLRDLELFQGGVAGVLLGDFYDFHGKLFAGLAIQGFFHDGGSTLADDLVIEYDEFILPTINNLDLVARVLFHRPSLNHSNNLSIYNRIASFIKRPSPYIEFLLSP